MQLRRLPDQAYFEIARVLRDECRDFHFNDLLEQGNTVGTFVLTPGHEVSRAARKAVEAIALKYGKPFGTKVRFFSKADQ